MRNALLLAASSSCAAFLVGPPPLTRPHVRVTTAVRRIAWPVRASAAAALPSSDSPGMDGTAASSGLSWWEPLLVVLRWMRSRLFALLALLRLRRRAPVMGAVLPVACVMLDMHLVRGNATREFEPPSMLLQHFGYGVSPFYAALRAPRVAPNKGAAAAESAEVAVPPVGMRWLQRGDGPPPRHWVDRTADLSRLEYLQTLYDEVREPGARPGSGAGRGGAGSGPGQGPGRGPVRGLAGVGVGVWRLCPCCGSPRP